MEFNVQNVIAEPGAHVVIGPTIIDDTNASTLQNEIGVYINCIIFYNIVIHNCLKYINKCHK